MVKTTYGWLCHVEMDENYEQTKMGTYLNQIYKSDSRFIGCVFRFHGYYCMVNH